MGLYYLVEIGKKNKKKRNLKQKSNRLSKLTLLGPKYAAITTTALILYLLFYMIILLHNKTGFWVFFLQLTTPPPKFAPPNSSNIYFYSYFLYIFLRLVAYL